MTDGVQWAYSDLTDTWYRVTEWEDAGDGKLIAHEKERVDDERVPSHVKEARR